ncbi:MAG: hypothetical protein GEU88_13105 [Solirubrobacterales bacterium]|nr:hypothetical protein [Solirubrobacterales bacterium]
MRHLKAQHLLVATVSAATITIALLGGGFEPSAFAGAALVVWIAVLVGLAAGWLPRSEPPASAIATGLCLAGFAALTALSLAWGNDAGGGFEDLVRVLAYVGALVLVIVASRYGEAGAWLRGLAIGLAVVGAIALLARFEPSLFGEPDAELAARVPAALGRLSYPIGYWNGLAALMAAALLLLTWLGAGAVTRAARVAAVAVMPIAALALWATDSRGGIVALVIGVAILLVVGPRRSRLAANLTIGGLGGLALIGVGLGFDALFNAPTSPDAASQGDVMLAVTVVACALTALVRFLLDAPVQRFAVGRGLARAAVALVAVAIVAGIALSDPAERWDEFKAAPQASQLADGDVSLLRGTGSGRYQFWGTALDAFESAPVGGVGADGYSSYWFEHRDEPLDATRAHSLFFESLAELGVVGFALVCGFLAIPAVVGVRRWRAGARAGPAALVAPGPRELAPALGVLAIGIVTAGVDWTFDLPAVFAPTVLAAALLAGNATLPPGTPDRAPTSPGTVRSRRRFAGGVAILLGAWIAICAAGLVLLADRALTSSQHAAARGDLAEAIDDANSAIDLEPWAADPRTQLALLYHEAGRTEAARSTLAEAIDRAPRDYRLQLLALNMDRAAGDLPAAVASYLRARALNPLDPRIQEMEQALEQGS